MNATPYFLVKRAKDGYIGITGGFAMKLFGDDVKVIRGNVGWTNPLRLRISVLHPEDEAAEPDVPAALEAPAEFDEEGRRYVFRFARAVPEQRSIDRDRIFDYIRKHKLPSEGARSYLRDMRNAADFYEDVRDIQTPYDVEVRNRLRP